MTQASDSMNNMYEKSEQHQIGIIVNASLHNQSHQGDSILDENHDQDCKCELQQLDIKPCIFLHQKPDLNFKSELPASTLNSLSQNDQQYQDDKTIISTQHQEYQAYISMTSSKECNGLYFSFINVRHSKCLCIEMKKQIKKENKAMMCGKSLPSVHIKRKQFKQLFYY